MNSKCLYYLAQSQKSFENNFAYEKKKTLAAVLKAIFNFDKEPGRKGETHHHNSARLLKVEHKQNQRALCLLVSLFYFFC